MGPVLLVPTATDDLLGGKKWGIGPIGVALKQLGPWTFGALANHIWSFAGSDRRADVNATFMQPFLSYTWPKGFAATVNSEATYDWTGKEWTVPLFAGVSQVTRFGQRPVSIAGRVRYFAEAPAGAPDWGVRVVLTLLYPRGR